MASYKQIFELIESMSLSEKRHFDLLSNLYDRERYYIVLYGEIKRFLEQKKQNPGKVFDEVRFERKLGIQPHRLSDLRAYLYRLLLQSMRMLHQEENQDFVIMNLLYEAKLLHRKGLFDAALERYGAALKHATEYAYTNLSIEAIKGLVTIQSQLDTPDQLQLTEHLLTNLAEMAQQQHDETLVFGFHFNVGMAVRTKKNAMSVNEAPQILSLGDHPLLQQEVSSSFLTQIYRYACLACLALLKKDWDQARKYYGNIIAHSGWFENRIKEYMRLYIIFMSNYLTYCIKTKTYDDVTERLEELGKITPTSLDDQAELFQNLYYLKQLYHLNRGELEEAANLIPKIEEGLKKHVTKINKARERTLRYNMMIVLFALSRFDESLDHANHIVEMKRSAHRQDLQAIAKIFQLIILFEQNNHEYLDTRVKSIVQNLGRNDDLFDFERTVLHFLGRLAKLRYQNRMESKAKQKSSELTLFESFKNALETLKGNFGPAHPMPIGFEGCGSNLMYLCEKNRIHHGSTIQN